MNLQTISKQVLSDGEWINVHSIFYTIQGEGPFAGERAVFIRLAGCNLQCPMCDTVYTGPEVKALRVKEIADKVKVSADPPHLVVLTGGEPFRQNIKMLVNHLLAIGYTVQIETNGTLFVDLWSGSDYGQDDYLHIVCSPKTGKLNPDLVPHIDAFKYVLDATSVNEIDGLPLKALDHPVHPFVARPPPSFTGEVYLQPADVVGDVLNRMNRDKVVESCMTYGYKLCLQMHKIVGLP